MIKSDLQLKEVPISSVKLWKDNPRKNMAAVPKLAAVIKERGQISPVVVWRKTGVCYKGNTTILAMKTLGIKTVRVLYADFPSEQAAIAFGIADNKSSEFSEWDDSLLNKFLSMPEIKNTGFTIKETSMFNSFDAKIEIVPLIDKLLSAFKIFKESSLNILNFVYVQNKKIRFTNLDVFVEAPLNVPDGVYDLKKYMHINDFKYCKTDLQINDFPCLPDSKNMKEVTLDLNRDLKKFVPFASEDQSRAVLNSVCFSKDKIFSTDGYVLLMTPSKNSIEVSLSLEHINILSCFDKSIKNYSDGKWIKSVLQDGITVYGKSNEGTLPIIDAIIKEVPSFQEVNRQLLLNQTKKILPLATSKTNMIYLGKGKIATEEIACAADIDLDVACSCIFLEKMLSAFTEEKISIGYSGGEQGQIQFRQSDKMFGLVMCLRILLESINKNAPIVFKSEKPTIDLMKKFIVKGHDMKMNVSCLHSIEKQVKTILNEQGFIDN